MAGEKVPEREDTVPATHAQRVVFQPAARQAMQRGIDRIVDALRPTLGPRPRTVAVASQVDRKPPEILDDGGLIARRIIQLADPDEDMGAMYLRHLLWRLHEKVGDGTATAAVLFKAIYDEGVRYIVSGGEAMLLRQYLEQGLRVVLDQLHGMVVRVEGKEALEGVAETICCDPPLARLLGEIFDIIGEFGQLEIRQGRGRELEREYVEGMYWKSGLHSRQMITDPARFRAELEDAAILISDLEIKEARELLPVLERTSGAGIRSLLIVATVVSENALGLLRMNSEAARLRCIAAKVPGIKSDEQIDALQELALLTGGRPVLKGAGDTLAGVTVEHFGRARRVWADATHLGISGGGGDPRQLRSHIGGLREAFARTEDPVARKRIQERLGKLMGGSAILTIGGISDRSIASRMGLARRTAEALRGSVREGVLPGGGVTLLACQPDLLRRMSASIETDERAAYRILAKAMEAPIRTILANAGLNVGKLMAEIVHAGPCYGWDARIGRVVDMKEAGVLDSAEVQLAAVRGAVSSAALALTVDVLVHRRKPVQATAP